MQISRGQAEPLTGTLGLLAACAARRMQLSFCAAADLLAISASGAPPGRGVPAAVGRVLVACPGALARRCEGALADKVAVACRLAGQRGAAGPGTTTGKPPAAGGSSSAGQNCLSYRMLLRTLRGFQPSDSE